ncbi:MAG TPA: 30S ribosomal protein S12 methylthiotransferase RimO [Actinocrinis sp.]|jgi:ribosomal protein S12 methylthiotransferase RimO|uniref:30S ribosomal protein S12 methylthiotransferase RimO n=1 Tax=Actinocrinis sp. TaxID=1920516 RepID=UPI002DDD6F3C|nr:30S ribosomal protein S12 methylthiotransferase RimO [Actinocrinis sp.]HEV3169965.1 30S ribosomal protein S12 methylthiotransferase RimO [Actinocrinis sp.]
MSSSPPAPDARTVALVTLGCARNDVDSEELAGRLAADGWELVEDAAQAAVAVVNTCGFVDSAKKDSIDTLLAAADLKGNGVTKAVVAVGCLAERYGVQLADELPEADAVLGFDDYREIGDRLRTILGGGHVPAHTPADRRRLLPLTPVERSAAAVAVPGHETAPIPAPVADLPAGVAPASGPRVPRRRLAGGPSAPLKLASGCDRRCAFCAIPSFRGAFLSRRPTDILAEARWLADQGVREIVLVSENSTSYGKDLGDLRLLETLLPELAAIDALDWIRVSYLQPAELRPSLIDALVDTPKVVPYFDLSFQHSAPDLLRRMRRFGDTDRFLGLLAAIRERVPAAGARSNFIVGFPGETEDDVKELERFLTEARLDAIGVFGYSDEDGTEAAGFDGKLDQDVIDERVALLTDLAEELTAQRAADRVGETVDVLVEQIDGTEGLVEGRAPHQGPETDGSIRLVGDGARSLRVGALVRAVVVDSDGVDLIAAPA